jgi:conjugative relaxase-like TrwC/TraI family protein
MVSIGKLGSGQETYYLEKVAEGAEDYYSGEGEAEGVWISQAAARFGLEGKVEPDQLTAMLTGRNPVTGEPLGLKSAPGREPVPGFDLTFSAPKSVSLTWALGGHPVSGQIMDAHRTAVEAALSYMERSACWARRGKGGATFVPGQGFLAAAYVHRSSRAADPQLHTHVLVANATLGADGRWSRLYHPAIYEHARTASYLYAAHLRHELTQKLGIEWEPVVGGLADIRGFSTEELRTFSTRRAQILAVAGEGASAKAMRVAALETRQAKDRDITDESLREGWRMRAEEIGLTREKIAGRLGHERPGASVLTARQVERSVTAHVSHFDRRDAIRAVAENLPHGAPAHEVERLADEFLASDSVRRIAETPRGPRFTTERIWELERRAIAVAEQMHGAGGVAVVDPILVRRVLVTYPSLKADQRVMVERLLGDGRALEVVVGEAGTGKTYATAAAAAAWSDSGYEVEAAAPTWRAATVLRGEGIPARTVASLIARLDQAEEAGREALRPGWVLLVDEAGMVDSQTLARLIDHARRSEAKLVLLGDPAQLGEIEAGGLFAAIARRTEEIRLDEVIRHRHDLDREGAKLIREGEGSQALDRYAREGRVVVAADHELRREAIVSDWREARRRGEDTLMIAKLNSERERLNERAREAMRAEGRLGEGEIEVGGRSFAAGDEVITRVNDQRIQIFNRERWRVEAVDRRAQAMVLVGIDTDGRLLHVDADYLGRVNPSDGAPAVEHGYAVTIYQAQGSTLDSAYVMADPSMDRQEFYVAASRTRGETFLYATPEVGFDRIEFAPAPPRAEDLEHIARAAERDGSQAAAHDAALRERLAQLSTEELYARRRELASEAGAERRDEWVAGELGRRLDQADKLKERFACQPERLGEEPPIWARSERATYREEAAKIAERQTRADRRLAEVQAEVVAAARVEYAARAELAVTEHLIEKRIGTRLAAVRLDTPEYLTRELGERPTDPDRRWAWDRSVAQIERYRQEHGIRDRDTALGAEPRDPIVRAEHRQAMEALRRAQRQLRLEQARQARVLEQTRSMGIEM